MLKAMSKRLCAAVLCLSIPRPGGSEGTAGPVSVAEFTIREPLGQTWTDEWLTQEFTADFGRSRVDAGRLRLRTRDGEAVPCQFYALPGGLLLEDRDVLAGRVTLRVLFKATVPRNEPLPFVVDDGGGVPPSWHRVTVTERGTRTIVSNGVYEIEFDPAAPLPISALRCGGVRGTLGTFAWPRDVVPTGVSDEWIERGPARAILRRVFRFRDGAHRYEVTFDVRAGDPWMDIGDDYSLGEGTTITMDLQGLGADFVYHPHSYNARTFRPDGRDEDSTLEPPQHPIATLGPVWRDIWYGGGPFAFVYNSGADHGVGFAAVRGSEWETPEGISPESQNLEVHGDAKEEGKVWVRIPTDGGRRRWAVIIGPPEVRKHLSRMTRSRADIPLGTVLKEWVLDWPSDAREVGFGSAGVYLGAHFNRHFLNPTTFPRRVRGELDRLLSQGGEVKSRGLAVIAYVFTDPDYWPGPGYRWKIGNPNFHTDMYTIPLRVALLMPDHPHAKRWLDHGVGELKGDLMGNSYPGGAWQESLSYSMYGVRHIVESARLLLRGGAMNPFKEWPRFKEVLTYLACMHTPVDPRYGTRQIAPIGDTSPGNFTGELRACSVFYRGVDDILAEQLERFPERWEGALDLGSREFPGFGAMLRGNPYDERHESFAAIKAGPARDHYQGDELSFFFAGLGTPLALDYACHYSPRPWHAAMHNRPDMNNRRPVAVGVPRAFRTSPAGDVFVADERTTRINHVPLVPHETHKPGWEYPTTFLPEDQAWTMRRYVMMVKHDPQKSRIADYLVVRDEILSPEPVWWNLHVLGREIVPDGERFLFPGQLDVDVTVHIQSPKIGAIERRQWGWGGKSGDRRGLKGAEYERKVFGAYLPEDFRRGSWGPSDGEMGQWLRVKGAAGPTDWLVVIIPHLRSKDAPVVENLSATSARITLGGESEIVHLGTSGTSQAAVERAGKVTVLLQAGEVKPLSGLGFAPDPAR